MSIRISIIVPTYNASKYIERCMYSVLDQCKEFANQIEIIIVNDGSTDNTESLVKEIISCNPTQNISLISIENGGLANARNIGLNRANGEYFINLDADDFLQNGIIEKLLNAIKIHQPYCCFFGFQDYDENRHSIVEKYDARFNYVKDIISGEQAFCYKAAKYIWICQGSACYRRTILEKNNIYNIKGVNQGEDFLFIMSFLACSSKVISIPIIGVNISFRADSMMHESFNESHLQVFDAISILYMRISELNAQIDKEELLEWIDVEFELERMAVAKKIIMSYCDDKNIMKKKLILIPPYKHYNINKLSFPKRIESWIFNHNLTIYYALTRVFKYFKGMRSR